MRFSKYHGTGNDFILIADHDADSFPNVAKKVCARRYGVGADGVILVRSHTHSQAVVTLFNPDGSLAEMCGNALRCICQFLIDRGSQNKELSVTLNKKQYLVLVQGKDFVVDMGLPSILEEGTLDGISYTHVDSGASHFVHFCENVHLEDFGRIAHHFRFHKRFDPVGVNVNFVRLLSPKLLQMRTYEKGVEGETLSCGTGAVASCVAAWKKYGICGEIDVEFASKEHLVFDLVEKGGVLCSVKMKGGAVFVYRGEWAR